MSFVVDGDDWLFDGMASQDIHGAVSRGLVAVSDAIAAGETVWIGDDFQHRPMFAGEDLWTIFGRTGPLALPDQLLQELTAWLMTAPYYADVEDWPEGVDDIDISIDGAPARPNADVAWVHHSVRSGVRIGVMSLSRSGDLSTATSFGEEKIFFVSENLDRLAFWRSYLRNARSIEILLELASKAYPDIYFMDGAIAGANDFTGGYFPFRDDIHAVFEALNDFGAWIFQAPPPALSVHEPVQPELNSSPSRKIIEDRFQRVGVDAAPENPDVFQSRVKRTAREVSIGGETLYCEWHIRIQKHQNRIHIHAPTEGSGGRVVVAILHSHLP